METTATTTQYIIAVHPTPNARFRFYKYQRHQGQMLRVIRTWDANLAKQFTSEADAEATCESLRADYPKMFFTAVKNEA